MLPGGAVLDAGAETLFTGRSKDNKAGGGAVLGAGVEAHSSARDAGVEAHGSARDAGVEAHGSTGGAVSEKKNQEQNYMR